MSKKIEKHLNNGNLRKAIWEHLKTKKKYNTLLLKYDVLQEDLEKKIIELNAQKRINQKEKEIWDQKLKEQEEEIIKLKKRKINASNKSKEKANKKN